MKFKKNNSVTTNIFNYQRFKELLNVILFISILMMSSNLYSQTSTPTELEKIDSQIESLRIKRDWIEGIPEEDSIAVAQGWYIKTEQALSDLNSKKRKIIMDDSGKIWVSIEEYEEMPEEKKQIVTSNNNYIIEQ